MKAVKIWTCVAALAAGGMLAWPAMSQESPSKAAAKQQSRGRLPAQYGKLGLADETKDDLYKIDEEYDAKIGELTAQIKELQAERESKMQEKLTDAQRAQLKTLRDEAAAKRASAAEVKPKTDPAPKPADPDTDRKKI